MRRIPYRSRTGKARGTAAKPLVVTTKDKQQAKKTQETKVARIAKDVYYKQTETKWKGKEEVWQMTIDSDVATSSFYASVNAVYLMARGSNDQARVGSQVQSLRVQNRLTIASNYGFPMFVRVLLLEAKNAQLIPQYNNVLVSPQTKEAIEPTFVQRDLHYTINTDVWKPHIDRKIFLYGNTSQPDGWDRFCKNVTINKKRKIRLYYEDDQQQPDETQPIKNNLYWCYFITFPSNEIVPSAPPVDQFINFSSLTYHYFKDV